jgi:hypothetical protein
MPLTFQVVIRKPIAGLSEAPPPHHQTEEVCLQLFTCGPRSGAPRDEELNGQRVGKKLKKLWLMFVFANEGAVFVSTRHSFQSRAASLQKFLAYKRTSTHAWVLAFLLSARGGCPIIGFTCRIGPIASADRVTAVWIIGWELVNIHFHV